MQMTPDIESRAHAKATWLLRNASLDNLTKALLEAYEAGRREALTQAMTTITPLAVKTPAFLRLWEAYRAVSTTDQYQAAVEYERLSSALPGGSDAILALILASLSWQVPEYLRREPSKRPRLLTYLQARRWEDEPPVRTAPRSIMSAACSTCHAVPCQCYVLRELRDLGGKL